MAALAAAPAAAQTVTISASGNCGGTPANCGTSGNRNGDRDTTWPGLQVDEGDVVYIHHYIEQSASYRVRSCPPGFEGSLGDGEGGWRLAVSSDAPLAAMSLVEDERGALGNLSTPGPRTLRHHPP